LLKNKVVSLLQCEAIQTFRGNEIKQQGFLASALVDCEWLWAFSYRFNPPPSPQKIFQDAKAKNKILAPAENQALVVQPEGGLFTRVSNKMFLRHTSLLPASD
jgi:hypothetical protein